MGIQVSGVARNIFYRGKVYALTYLRGSASDSTDSQIISSMGGTTLQVDSLVGWKKLFQKTMNVFLHVISNAPA